MRRLCCALIAVTIMMMVSCATSVTTAPEQATTEAPAKSSGMEEVLMADTSALSLYKAYEDDGIIIGSCVYPVDFSDWGKEKLETQFASISPFNGLRAEDLLDQEKSIRNGRLTVVFSDDLVSQMEWAREHGKKVHRAALIWWQSCPDWIFREDFRDDSPYVSRDVLLGRLEDYISGVFSGIDEKGWGDLFFCYDVVSEYINTEGTGLNPMPWVSIIGDDMIEHAFSFARKYAPKGLRLIYNEHFCENNEVKRDAVIDLVGKLAEKSLLDGLGLQCRLFLRFDIDRTCGNIRHIAQNIGDLELQLTEIDCCFNANGKNLQANLKKQGTYYYKVMETMMKLKEEGCNVTAVQTFGFWDQNSVMGASNAPLLYDVNGVEKYSYFGLLQMRDLSGFEE